MPSRGGLGWGWGRDEGLDCKFLCQHPYLDNVLDFVCLEKSLIVEVDGGQHLENQRDQARDWRLQEAGFRVFRVLRFWSNQVLQATVRWSDYLDRFTERGGYTPSPPQPSP